MKWESLRLRNPDCVEAKTKNIRLVVVKGHVQDPEHWLLDTNPEIFKGHYKLGCTELSIEEACKKAEQVTKDRLKAMLHELEE